MPAWTPWCVSSCVFCESKIVACINTLLWMLECILDLLLFCCLVCSMGCIFICVFYVIHYVSLCLPPTPSFVCACVFCVSMCVRVCVCLTSHLGGLTEWRICAVIVVWLSSCCNWKCLIGETFVKMFIRACHLTLTQLLLLPVQLLKCSPPLTLDVEPVPFWNWVNYHTNCLV